jgi:hypothetical protein
VSPDFCILVLPFHSEERMTNYYILGFPDNVTGEVRRTLRSPEYGHPVVRELATGTGPCRACLGPFRVGEEERLLFTYRPAGGSGTLGAPGPVFIHARECAQYRGTSFPRALHFLPLLVEARAGENRIPQAQRASGADIDVILAHLLADPEVEYVHVRHGEAGCHIARVDRGPLPSAAV